MSQVVAYVGTAGAPAALACISYQLVLQQAGRTTCTLSAHVLACVPAVLFENGDNKTYILHKEKYQFLPEDSNEGEQSDI
jgi:hypothetical protein